MTIAHRFVEACALLPMLYVQPARRNIVFCSGPCAELFAVDVLRWRDVAQVFVPELTTKLRDPRVVVGKPPVGACSAVILSPDENPEPAAAALAKDGVINACTRDPARFTALLKLMRRLFPRSVSPWREHLPEVLYGTLASPQGAPKRLRNPPGGARRITAQYLPCLFTFGGDEMPTVFGPVETTTPLSTPVIAPVPVGASRG